MVTHCRLVLEVQFYHTDSVSEDERYGSSSNGGKTMTTEKTTNVASMQPFVSRIVPVTLADAKAFVARHHRHSSRIAATSL
jgi:hypothetical protein